MRRLFENTRKGWYKSYRNDRKKLGHHFMSTYLVNSPTYRSYALGPQPGICLFLGRYHRLRWSMESFKYGLRRFYG